MANNITATMAIIVVAWGAFIYINDVRYMAGNIAVRNIGWAQKEICTGNDNDLLQLKMHEYLAEELQRYKRYTGRVHLLDKTGDICGDFDD